MLVPGLPITDLAVESVVANGQRSGAVAARAQLRPGAVREAVNAWQARLLFAACYVFVVGLVVMAG